MNDRDLDLTLAAMGARHTRVRVPPGLRKQVRAVPLEVPQRRSRLPHIDDWRLHPMFSATKFIVAGVIVALFGSLLLVGVVKRQQGEGTSPAVGAAASTEATPLVASVAPEPPRTDADQSSTKTDRPIRLPSEIPAGIESGTLGTPLGQARWVHLQAAWGQPWGPLPLPSPEGFLLLDRDEPTLLWRSPDLIEWTAEPLPVDGRYAWLELADGTYWLLTSGPTGLWRSEDTVTWQQIDLDELASPFPEWLDAGPGLEGLISSAGVTIVPYRYWPRVTGSDLGLPDIDGTDWWLESSDPGTYVAIGRWRSTRGIRIRAHLRFEETETGLRVIDASDETELATLDGVDLDFIQRWAELGYPEEVSHLAIVEGDALVPVERPEWLDQELPGSPAQERRVFGTESGMVVYRYGPDSDVVRVWRSDDGVTWSETDPLGDESGEPTRLHDIRPDGPSGELEAVAWEGAWLSSDGVTWRESERPPRESEPSDEAPEFEAAVRMASGWLSLSDDQLSYKLDGSDEWTTTDVTELGIDVDPGEWGIVDSGVHVYAISPDTIVVPAEHEMWIITFDDLPE